MPVDAMGKGTPVVTAGFPENLAVDNIEVGRNGYIATPPTPSELAAGIVKVLSGGPALRDATLNWYKEHAPTKTVSCSVRQLVTLHAGLSGSGQPPDLAAINEHLINASLH